MHFDDGCRADLDRVEHGRRIGAARWIDDDSGRRARRLNELDELWFTVGLTKLHLHAGNIANATANALDIRERPGPVNLRFELAEQIEVRPIENMSHATFVLRHNSRPLLASLQTVEDSPRVGNDGTANRTLLGGKPCTAAEQDELTPRVRFQLMRFDSVPVFGRQTTDKF